MNAGAGSPRERLLRELQSSAEALRRLESELGRPAADALQERSGDSSVLRKAHYSSIFNQAPAWMAPEFADSEAGSTRRIRKEERPAAGFSTATLCASMLLRPPGSPPVPGLRCVSVDAHPKAGLDPKLLEKFLPRYRFEEAIGRGGMGTVYRAFDRQRKVSVALKVFPFETHARFHPAYKLLRTLRHPAILPVGKFEALGTAASMLETPVVKGVSLSMLIACSGAGSGVLKLAFRRACEGVAYAHERRVVHRDLKPSNIMVDEMGRAVVVDWDLACRSGEPPQTQGGLLGTPLYMAPELIDGGPATERSDVFSLGVLLYEILTGINPCGPGGGLEEVFHRIRKEMPPPPSTLREGISPDLDAIAMRCLEKAPAGRYPSAAELLEDLEGL